MHMRKHEREVITQGSVERESLLPLLSLAWHLGIIHSSLVGKGRERGDQRREEEEEEELDRASS